MWKVFDGRNLDWVYLNAVLGDHMPQVLYPLSNKLALLWPETKTSSIQMVHDLLQVRKVIFKSSDEHQYIVDVVHADLLCQPSQNCLERMALPDCCCSRSRTSVKQELIATVSREL